MARVAMARSLGRLVRVDHVAVARAALVASVEADEAVMDRRAAVVSVAVARAAAMVLTIDAHPHPTGKAGRTSSSVATVVDREAQVVVLVVRVVASVDAAVRAVVDQAVPALAEQVPSRWHRPT